MHELSVTENLLEIALRHAGQAVSDDSPGNIKIANLYLVIGQLSSIVNDSVQFYWDIIAKDTPAEGAKLHFRRVPAELLCLDCNTSYHPSMDELACPNCHSARIKIISGEEFYLEAIDIEKKA